ncbi:hypothetical protein BGX31_002484, partial [Mortierella sp. GBA43]
MFGSIVASPRSTLSPKQALDLAKIYLENARQMTDTKIALVLCHDTEVSLSQARKAAKHAKDTSVQDGVAAVYNDLGLLLHGCGYQSEAQASFEKAQKLGAPACDLAQLLQRQDSQSSSTLGSIIGPLVATVDVPVAIASPTHHLSLPTTLRSNSDNAHGYATIATLTENTTVARSAVVTVSRTNAASVPRDNVAKEPKGDKFTIHPSNTATAFSIDTTIPPSDNGTALPGDHAITPPAGISTSDPSTSASAENATVPEGDIATVPLSIFIGNVRPPAISFKPPEADERLHDTLQLACCLGLLQISTSLDEITDPVILKWLQVTQANPDEKDRLETMAKNVIRAFKRDELKDSKAVTEVVYLAPILEKDDFQYLLREFYSGIDHSGLLDITQLEGLAQLIQGADTGFIEADDFVKILKLL